MKCPACGKEDVARLLQDPDTGEIQCAEDYLDQFLSDGTVVANVLVDGDES